MKLIISGSSKSKSLYIAETFRNSEGKVTSRTVKSLGTMSNLLPLHNNSEEEVIAWGKTEAKRMTEEDKKNNGKVIVTYSQSQQIPKDKQNTFNAGYLFLQDIFYNLKLDKLCKEIQKEFKFEYDLTNILSRLIYTRMLYPSSKRSTFVDSRKFIEQPIFELHDIYRSLDILDQKSDYIQQYLYEKSLNVVERNTSVLYYDCTNYFFEIEEETEDCKYGKNKENRPLPIIQMGLFMDGNGFPLSFVMFPGNQSEQPSLIPLEKRIIRDFKLSKFIVCTDAGLASNDNRKFNNKSERSYIVTQSLKTIKKHIQDWALSTDGWSKGDEKDINIDDIITKVDSGEAYEDGIWYKERYINENGLEQRIIVSFSPKYRSYQRNIRDKQIERAKAAAAKNKKKTHRNPNSPERFLDEINTTDEGEVASNKTVVVAQSRIDKEEKFDGFYAVCTTLEDDIQEIIKVNKRRWEIEESFRIMKSEFKARPVYVRKSSRIKAHFLTCFLALMFIRVLEDRTNHKITVEKLISTLQEYNLTHIEGKGYVPIYTRNDETDILHDSFNFRTDYEIVSERNMKEILKATKS